MSEPENITRFNQAVGMTLAVLYEEFPKRITLRVGRVLGLEVNEEDDPLDGSPIRALDNAGNEFQVTYSELDFALNTVRWLADSGYLLAGQFRGPFFVDDVTLSAKGLELLKCVPSSVDPSASFGDELRTMARSSGQDAMSGLVSTALTTGFRLLVPGA
ncbi:MULTISPECIES: hypothetical protein [Marinobacter]|uniref:Uncharacterized protein n=1 Tax=Marinobacter sp. MMG032 TaxID=3158548 RepID=A0AAU7MTM8_9GAMM|nr:MULTISPECIES: hypothetical protein [Marinobacter]MBY5939045.1 hypothetical protein [Marinobacter nauticus]MBY5956440.1 hypothetical protein [Marinobacter nauticus]MBY6010254.1 hypothetical protein [Marinobacter nauticus]